jgi:hypothetical protein
MAETKRKQPQQRRSKARTREGPKASEPFEQLGETAEAEEPSGGRGDVRAAAKRTLATAAAGALAAGLAGAAKAALERRAQATESETPEGEQPDRREGADDDSPAPAADPQAEAVDETDDAAAADEPLARERASEDPQDEPQEDERPSSPESGDRAEEPQSREPGRERDDRNQHPQQQRGAEAKDAAAVIDEARSQLESLLGLEVESVSGVERSDGQWSVMLEAVGLRRIPETTDVLASYEVVLDDDRKLVRVAQTRRYLRSQVEEVR